ncbi:MAG: sulfatase family protein [Pleomorphochaeta sp.]
MKKPNILWICTDQQRFDTLGCYGNKHTHTPNLDKLAKEGVLFENAFCQSPVCSPSRSSFLTGRYPRTTGCRENGQRIFTSEKVISKTLHENGYVCGLSGKYHINPANPDFFPQGEVRIDDGYDVFEWSHGHAYKHASNAYQRWLNDIGVEYKKEEYDFCKWIEKGMPEEYHQTTWCVERAKSFVDSAKNFDSPWMFSINIFDPHNPFDPPQDYLERYTKNLNDIPLPNYEEGELANKPEYQKLLHQSCLNVNPENIKTLLPAKMSDSDHRYVKAAYWAMCDLIDSQVGKMVEYLKEIGQYDNTIIIFNSDHGEMLGDHGLYYKAINMYDSAVHIPLIIHYPAKLKPRKVKAVLELMHIAPTLLEAANLPIEKGMQTTSIWDQLINEKTIESEDVYCEYYNSLKENRISPRECYGTMVRNEKFKIILYHGTSEGELYDLINDPSETHNLFDNPEYTVQKTDMLVRLCNKMSWTVDPLPIREGAF